MQTALSERVDRASLHPAERWVAEQIFEEDLRSVLRMLRPHRRERLLGWNEYRTGGAHYRVTVSWDDDYEAENANGPLHVPRLVEILESLIVGTARNQDDLTAPEEFALYKSVVRELSKRIDEMESCYT
jgi:hypothetical protein